MKSIAQPTTAMPAMDTEPAFIDAPEDEPEEVPEAEPEEDPDPLWAAAEADPDPD